jgi:Putative zinc-finger
MREELGGYLLGALEPAERAAVERHLASCPACAAEHARLAALPGLLEQAEGLEIPAPPAAVEELVLDQIALERGAGRTAPRRRLRRRLRPGLPAWLTRGRALAAGTVAGVALGALVTALVAGGGDEPPAPRSYALVLHGDGSAQARAELSPQRGGTQVHLWVRGLPSGDTVYEVRCERPGWSASAGTFRADARGRAYVVLTTAARLGEYRSIRIVRRPDDADVLSGQLN